MNLKGRSFLTLKDFTAEEILGLIDLAADLKAKKKQLSVQPNCSFYKIEEVPSAHINLSDTILQSLNNKKLSFYGTFATISPNL